MRSIALVMALCGALPASAVCYRHPFGNPDLADGWGSTCCGRTNPHRGLDYPQAAGTHIPVIADGVVALRTTSSCLGNVVVVRHDDGMFSGYSHLLSGSPVPEGTRVSMGQIIGRVGNTGSCSFGAHLHLTIAPTQGGYASGTTSDPNAFINARLQCEPPPPPPCDRTAGLLTFSCDGAQSGQSCVNLNEPADPHSWADNFLCTAANWGIRWSSAGPLAGMSCTQVSEAAEPFAQAWSDNYLCVPEQSPLALAWSSAGPLAGQTCVHFNEPSDLANSWGDNYLCYTQVHRFSSDDFTFSSTGPVSGMTCESVNEPADSHGWADNQLCSRPALQLALRWSHAGPLEGMDCENIAEPAEHLPAAWSDNFLCLPPQSPYGLSWHSAGPLAGQACVRWFDWADLAGSWGDNFLCAVPLHDFSQGEFTFSSDGPNPGEHCVSVDEPLDPNGWSDNHLCTSLNLAMSWSSQGPLEGQDCTAITAPGETHQGWRDNHLCLPKGATHAFTWSTTGPLADQQCVRWYEAEDVESEWPSHYLCARLLEPEERTAPATPVAAAAEVPDGAPTGIVGSVGCSSVEGAFILAAVALLSRRRTQSAPR